MDKRLVNSLKKELKAFDKDLAGIDKQLKEKQQVRDTLAKLIGDLGGKPGKKPGPKPKKAGKKPGPKPKRVGKKPGPKPKRVGKKPGPKPKKVAKKPGPKKAGVKRRKRQPISDWVVAILQAANTPLPTKEIIEQLKAKGYIFPDGKTTAVYQALSRLGAAGLVAKTKEGYTLAKVEAKPAPVPVVVPEPAQ
ncbi:MAG: hypothetical protein P9M14_13625 [Candidatus Alcyoniella australis]|nr:hypothetical protein [Candidatus Alcyoniella australis]